MHVGDDGTIVRARLLLKTDPSEPFDLSDSTSIEFVFLSPKKRRFSRPGALTSDGKDGRCQYVTQAEDFDVRGRWRYQVLVVTPAGSWKSDVVKFKVDANI